MDADFAHFERATEPVPHMCPQPSRDLMVYCPFHGEYRQDLGGRVVTWKGEPVHRPVPLHACPMPALGGPAVLCEHCRTWRIRNANGSVSSTPAGGDEPQAQLLADNRTLVAHIGDLEADLAALRELPPDPHRNSPAWWRQAKAADLEAGWAALPDPPALPAEPGACSGCGLADPPPDSSGMCRYCRPDHPGNALLSPGPHVLTPRQRMEAWRESGFDGPAPCTCQVVPAPRGPAMVLVHLILTALRLIGAMTVVIWGVEIFGWLLRQVFG